LNKDVEKNVQIIKKVNFVNIAQLEIVMKKNWYQNIVLQIMGKLKQRVIFLVLWKEQKLMKVF